ncbi:MULTISPECIES: hypothetical protein [Sphingomonas]|uniref:hypothetical protein n=1 Tax=Sphingomonas TaxID=13687 RepID=UPI002549E21B|nr:MULTISPECIES: hypothetical protein [Sphingomonas]MDK8187735.1 hypothetical protein [Sphingomonas zeae]MDK8217590.1 hypothetical protein [Sphingomonas sp. UMB7805-LC452B]
MTRDDVIGWLLIGASAGASGAAVTILYRTGFKSDDVFAFSGGLIGAFATIAGAMWLADRSAKTAHRREVRIIARECVARKAQAEKAIAEYRDTYPMPDGWFVAVRDLAIGAQETPAILREALDRAQTLDYRQIVKIRKAEAAVVSFDRFYQDCFCTEDELHPMDERDWPTTLKQLVDALEELQLELYIA